MICPDTAVLYFQIACIYQDLEHIKRLNSEVEKFFDNSWRKQTVLFSFNSLNSFLLPKIKQSTDKNILYVPKSSSGKVSMPKKTFDYFKKEGIEILPVNKLNHLEDISGDEETLLRRESENDIDNYLKGTIPPPWIIYYLNEPSKHPGRLARDLIHPLVFRETMEMLLEEVKKVERGKENIVARIAFVHQPGSGASTVARYVLWKLRKTRRTVLLDGNQYKENMSKLEDLAKTLLNLREFGEDEEVVQGKSHLQCPCVILLFDNATSQMTEELKAALERKCEQKGIVSNTRMLVMICVYSSFGFQNTDYNTHDNESKPIKLERKFSEEEIELFSKKLRELKEKYDGGPVDDLQSFIWKAHDYDEIARYVVNVVQNTVTSDEAAEERRRLRSSIAMTEWSTLMRLLLLDGLDNADVSKFS